MAIGIVHRRRRAIRRVFVPGGPVDKRQMVAGLLDLKQGKFLHSRVVCGGGAPMKPKVLAERNGLNLLLRDLLLPLAPQASVTGAAGQWVVAPRADPE